MGIIPQICGNGVRGKTRGRGGEEGERGGSSETREAQLPHPGASSPLQAFTHPLSVKYPVNNTHAHTRNVGVCQRSLLSVRL